MMTFRPCCIEPKQKDRPVAVLVNENTDDVIRNSGLNVIAGDNLADAAQKIAKAVKG